MTYTQMRNTLQQEEIQLITWVNGNTVRKTDCDRDRNSADRHSSKSVGRSGRNASGRNQKCEVYDFAQHTGSDKRISGTRQRSSDIVTGRGRRDSHSGKHRRVHKRMRSARYALCGVIAALMIAVLTGIGSRASSREFPKAYKYYDTITVGYQENLLDIVQRYDNREFYETQKDYVKELCRINNLAYDDTGYPEVSPGTHLVVPYYSEELK